VSLDAAAPDLRRRLQDALTGRYAIESEIARGGMATVFSARDLRHDRLVAVKLLDPRLTSSIVVERFLREIRITARLQHPHILPLLDSGQENGLVYYVMPQVSGESLRERLSREPPLPVGAAVWIAREVADALAYAHAQGVVHRDIKPENILLSDGHAIVADFGIARAVASCANCDDTGITVVGLPIGTPAYMSPEQAEGSADVDGRSDVYALGCVLFEMLAGRPPFVGRSARQVMSLHVTTPPPSLRELRPGLPDGVARAVERAIAKNRTERFQSAAEFGDLLQLLAATELVAHGDAARGGDPAPAGVGAPPSARGGRLLIGAALVAALALGVTALPIGRDRPPSDPPPSGSAEGPAPRAAADPGSAPRPAVPPSYTASIAVMPLADYSGDAGSRFLSEGLTEEIIAQLAKIRGLKVISRTSVVALAGKGLTIPEIAETLGVSSVLEGSVQRAGERIRVTLQLIDARNDAHLWAESYDRSLADVFALRQEIAQKVGRALAMAVPGVEAPETARSETGPAYDAYLRGGYWLTRTNPAGLEQAIAAFEEAIRLDSSYAPAYAGLSSALRQWVNLGYGGARDPYPTFARAARMAERALALDPELAAGYVARSMVRTFGWAPARDARADLERALALTPNAGAVHAAYAAGLAREGRYEQAVGQALIATQLDPLSPIAHAGLAVTALGGRRYDLAIEASRRSLALEPNFVGGYAIEGAALALLGRAAECLALELDGFPEVRAICLHAAGRAGEAAAVIDSIAGPYRAGRYAKTFQLGVVAGYYAALGDAARALEWLERAFAASPSGLDFRVLDSGLFDRLRDDADFRAGLARIHRRVADRVWR